MAKATGPAFYSVVVPFSTVVDGQDTIYSKGEVISADDPCFKKNLPAEWFAEWQPDHLPAAPAEKAAP
jgi:hypothetical protein